MMSRARTTLAIQGLLLAGCPAGPTNSPRLAANAIYCPVGTAWVCESLFEPARDVRPYPFGCADLASRR